MNKQVLKSFTAVSLALILMFSAVSGFAAVSGETEFQLKSDTTVQQNQLEVFEELKTLAGAEQADLNQVKAVYEAKIQAAVQSRNETIDTLISQLIEGGIEGQFSAGQVKQAVDKGLQWFFYDEITHLTKVVAVEALEAGDTKTAQVALDQAIELYAGSLGVTAGKRDSGLGTLTQHQLNTIIIPYLQLSLEQGNLTNYKVARQMFDKTLIKVYVLATAQYAEKANASYEANEIDTMKIQQTEGYFFFMPIYNSLSKGSKTAADAIQAAFAHQDASLLDGKQVEAWLAESLAVKINEYLEKTQAALDAGDDAKALEMAAEGITFVGALEIIHTHRFDADAFAKLSASTEAYYQAVNKIAEGEWDVTAKSESEAAIRQALSAYAGVNFVIGSKEIKKNGSATTYNELVNYLEPATNRTMASVRMISEAVGAQVDYDKETKTVQVTKGSDKIEMTVGSMNVTVNGAAEAVVLDQAAVIKDDRLYIPLRGLVELLGTKVYYQKDAGVSTVILF
ncbi:copper amine oxidase N-terminal domain-containing protein [Marinicrinis sediminis]|uniref:Copper amine oxidase N-terminal domain-containing protein n=1 Tax=Marinicrinis sediminis TaxID=1652465 RepID=A0ABW5RAM4_9BACL